MNFRKLPGILLLLVAMSGPVLAQRLPQTVRPSHYQLTFEPDFAADRFRGEAVIDIQLSQAASSIQMHAMDLTIESATIQAGGRSQQATVTTDPQNQTITLNVPEEIGEGPAQVSIPYSAAFGSGLRGFYSGMAGGRKYAATDFEPFDARRMFPAFDEPAMKATFDITAIVPRGDMAISNSPVVSEKNGPTPGTRTVRFATTPKMSTYLVALIVGNFECTEAKSEGTPIRVCATPDKKRLTGFAMEAAQASLRYFNRYFAIRYPFAKLDLIALPDFAAGAMENTGAVTFREALLLADPKEASLDTRKRIAVVIAHELAHQWFGDLVTMEWWDDIWLNEGFASWMETKPLAEWKPEWQMELDEVLELGSSLEQDARRATRPIRVPNTQAQTPAQVESLFDGIAYGKAATVLRMVENYVGEEGFRAGVNDYLKRHAYGNTRAADFWNAVAAATGKPVDKIMSTFVDQPGVPLVSVRTSCEAKQTEVTLTQRRFFSDGKQLREESGNRAGLWQIPVCFKTGDNRPAGCQVLSESEQTFRLNGCGTSAPVIFANAGAEGYYVAEYDPSVALALHEKVPLLSQPEQVLLLINDWALVTAGRRDLPSYLELAEAFRGSGTPAVWDEIATNLRFVSSQIVPDSAQEPYRVWLRGLLRPL
ncbi:MAG: M1 family metallopeptidase, partial [Candidatus Korobacteraceae bacterium]